MEKPDLVLLDVMMPGMDGFKVWKRLQQDPAAAAIQVIHLTARLAEVELTVVEAAQGPEWRYLVKPFTTTTLLDVLRHLFAESRAVTQTWMVQTREQRALAQHLVIESRGGLFVAAGALYSGHLSLHDDGKRVWVTTDGRRMRVPGALRRPLPGRRDPWPMLYLPIPKLEEQGVWTARVEATRWRVEIEPPASPGNDLPRH